LIFGVDANVLIYSAIQSMPEHKRVLSFFERRVLTRRDHLRGNVPGSPGIHACHYRSA
jgi:hypothetical protein